MTARVAGFGAIAVDTLIYLDQPLGVEKARVVDRAFAHGGNVATALVAVARLGGQAQFIGWINDGPAFADSLNDLHLNNVTTAHAPIREDAAPVRSTILVGSDGERFIAFDDAAPLGTAPDLTVERLDGAKVLLIDSYAAMSLEAVAAARALGCAIVADIEWSADDRSQPLMELSDHLVVPWTFAAQATGHTEPQAMLDALWAPERASVVVTRGNQGAYLRQSGDETLWHQPAHRVAHVDTTGAGDCFHGAYAYALALGQPQRDCVRFASAAAALSTAQQGGRAGLPSAQAVSDLLTRADAPQMTRF